MNTIIETTNSDTVDFEMHAAAAVKLDQVREMLIEGFDALDNPETEILAQIDELRDTVKAMFNRKGRAH